MNHSSELAALQKEIQENDVTKLAENTELFGGAGISVEYEKPANQEDGFYPDPTFVVTRFAKELSWLIFRLQRIFENNLDFANKQSFYESLAAAANKAIKEDKDNLQQILNNVLSAAREWPEE